MRVSDDRLTILGDFLINIRWRRSQTDSSGAVSTRGARWALESVDVWRCNVMGLLLAEQNEWE
jgi:hypothetical protein